MFAATDWITSHPEVEPGKAWRAISRFRGNGRFDVRGPKCSRAVTGQFHTNLGPRAELTSQVAFAKSSSLYRLTFAYWKNAKRTSNFASREKAAEARLLPFQSRFSGSVLKQELANSGQLRETYAGNKDFFSAVKTGWRREWDSKRPFRTDSLRSIRCRKPTSLP